MRVIITDGASFQCLMESLSVTRGAALPKTTFAWFFSWIWECIKECFGDWIWETLTEHKERLTQRLPVEDSGLLCNMTFEWVDAHGKTHWKRQELLPFAFSIEPSVEEGVIVTAVVYERENYVGRKIQPTVLLNQTAHVVQFWYNPASLNRSKGHVLSGYVCQDIRIGGLKTKSFSHLLAAN